MVLNIKIISIYTIIDILLIPFIGYIIGYAVALFLFKDKTFNNYDITGEEKALDILKQRDIAFGLSK